MVCCLLFDTGRGLCAALIWECLWYTSESLVGCCPFLVPSWGRVLPVHHQVPPEWALHQVWSLCARCQWHSGPSLWWHSLWCKVLSNSQPSISTISVHLVLFSPVADFSGTFLLCSGPMACWSHHIPLWFCPGQQPVGSWNRSGASIHYSHHLPTCWTLLCAAWNICKGFSLGNDLYFPFLLS